MKNMAIVHTKNIYEKKEYGSTCNMKIKEDCKIMCDDREADEYGF